MNPSHQSYRSKMGLTHISAYDVIFVYFSFFYVWNLMMTMNNLTNQMVVDPGLILLPIRAFCNFLLKYVLIESEHQ